MVKAKMALPHTKKILVLLPEELETQFTGTQQMKKSLLFQLDLFSFRVSYQPTVLIACFVGFVNRKLKKRTKIYLKSEMIANER